MRAIAAEGGGRDGSPPDAIDEDCHRRHLFTADMPDPDLLIRTSGEQRISNFLLWQCAYAELVFTKTLWPDFGQAAISNRRSLIFAAASAATGPRLARAERGLAAACAFCRRWCWRRSPLAAIWFGWPWLPIADRGWPRR